MSNYFKLIKSNSQYEIFSFKPTDDLLEVLKSNSVNEIEFDFRHNIIRIPNDKDSVFSFSIDKCDIDQDLISVDRNKSILNNFGKLKDMITDKENYQSKNSDSGKRKLESNNFSQKHSPIKKSLIDSNLDSEDEFSSRLSTRPKVTRSFPTETEISTLDESVTSNSQYEIFSFKPTDDLLEVLKSNSVNEIEFDFRHNIIRIPNDKDSVFSFSIDKCDIDQDLISVDRNKSILNNFGKLKDMITDKENYQSKNSDSGKRKLESNNFSEKHSPIKKSLIDSNLDSEDEFGSRLSTRPKVTRSFPTETEISILDELKLGKTIKQISNTFNISENKIKEFQFRESDIRRQYQESLIEQSELDKPSLPQPQSNEQNISEETDIKPPSKELTFSIYFFFIKN